MVLLCIDVASLWVVSSLFRAKDWMRVRHLCLAYLLAHSYIVFTLITTYLSSGHPLAFLSAHSEYSKWVYGGYNEPWVSKILYYPKLMIKQANPVFGFLALYGAGRAIARAGANVRICAPLVLGALVLLGYSLFNIWSVPPTAAPERFSMAFYIFFLPYAGYALARLTYTPQTAERVSGLRSVQWLALAALLLSGLWGLNQTRHFLMSKEWNGAVEAGYAIRDRMQQSNGEAGYLVELDFWQFLGVKLTAGHYDHQYFDRPFDVYQQHRPSLLQTDPEAFAEQLRAQRIETMAFRSPELVSLATRFGTIESRHRDWVVFRAVR